MATAAAIPDAKLVVIPGNVPNLIDLPKGPAAVGTLVIRFGTLWFGVIIGLIALALVSRKLHREPDAIIGAAEESAPAS